MDYWNTRNIYYNKIINMDNINEIKQKTTKITNDYLQAIYERNKKYKSDYKCEYCFDSGFTNSFIFVEENIQLGIDLTADEITNITAVECSCRKQRTLQKYLTNFEKRRNFKYSNLNNYETKTVEQSTIKKIAIKFLNELAQNNTTDWWYISGQIGAGKTHITTAICEKIFKLKKPIIYINFNDVIELERKLKLFKSQAEAIERVEELKEIEVLFIDDFFKKNISNYEESALHSIINARYDNNKITLFTSENSIKKVISNDEALGSRIYEKSKKYNIHIEPDITKNYRILT